MSTTTNDHDHDNVAPAAGEVADLVAHEADHEDGDHKAPGTLTLVFILLITFAIYYFANWKALSDVWHVR